MGKLKYQVWHAFDTPMGRFVSLDELDDWHCAPRKNKDGTVTYLGKTYKSLDYANVSEKHKGKWGRGWDRRGYTGYYQPDGTYVEVTPHNEDNEVQAHEMTWGATGVNAISRHMAYAGGRGKGKRKGKITLKNLSDAQFTAIERSMKDFIYHHPDCKIAGHYHFTDKKTCPNFPVEKFCEMIGIPTDNILYDGHIR